MRFTIKWIFFTELFICIIKPSCFLSCFICKMWVFIYLIKLMEINFCLERFFSCRKSFKNYFLSWTKSFIVIRTKINIFLWKTFTSSTTYVTSTKLLIRIINVMTFYSFCWTLMELFILPPPRPNVFLRTTQQCSYEFLLLL